MSRRRRSRRPSRKKFLRYAGAFTLLLASVILCVNTLKSPATASSDQSPLAMLGRVPVPELPAQAVALIHAAPASEKVDVTSNVVQAVAGLARPGTMPYVISAICRYDTNLADVATATAIQANSAPVLTLISAAIGAAPNMTEKISFAAFAANPGAFQEIALALMYRTKDSSTNILATMCAALPSMQTYVDTARLQADQVMAEENYQAAKNLAATIAATKAGEPPPQDSPGPNQSNNNQDEIAPTDAMGDDQSFNMTTNQDYKQLFYVVSYVNYAITNAGLTIEQSLTNDVTGANLQPEQSLLSTNAGTGFRTPTNGPSPSTKP
jgi:hypothetical protein